MGGIAMGPFRYLALALCAGAMTLTLCVSARAAEYTDLPEDHWAYVELDRAASYGILNGFEDGRMRPEGELTWGQYLKMLCRAFARTEYDAAVSGGKAWDQAGLDAAKQAGLLYEEDFLPVSGQTLCEPIRRQDVAVLLDRAVPEQAGAYQAGGEKSARDAWSALRDLAGIPASYQQSVARLWRLDIVRGGEDGLFRGGDTLRRADGAVLLMRSVAYYDRLHAGDKKRVTVRLCDSGGASLTPDRALDAVVGARLDLDRAVPGYLPDEKSRETQVSSVCDSYTVTLLPAGTVTQPPEAMQDPEGLHPPFPGWDEEPWGMDPSPGWNAQSQDSYPLSGREGGLADCGPLRCLGETLEKRRLLFGDENKRRFANREEAEENMADISVPVWRLNANGEKVSSTASLRVCAAVAGDVVDIFTEIYNDPERFPICDAGGYDWRGDSATGEHNCGTAIDINADANYQVRGGEAQAGSHYTPGEDPYSIPAGGSVVRIFNAHGWSWGGNAWEAFRPDYHDYMHFSYMGE